ncbi:P-loop containing nucleoside triphosphate hydrolase protein [Lipomyces arxii]|uniref:P-loop containing nucleoside triphosphate hydrolase protein n=1 Tax=Lipomyces arxii TaxID=56418 RepID=UPI0034CFA10C
MVFLKLSNSPVWEGVDFSPYFKEKYLHCLIPLALIGISGFTVWRQLLKYLKAKLERGVAPSVDDELVANSASVGRDSADLYQFQTLNSSVSNQINGYADDIDVILIRSHSPKLRIAFEYLFLCLLVFVHTSNLLLQSFWNAIEAKPGPVMTHFVAVLFWVYAIVVVLCRNSAADTDAPSSLWINTALLYFAQWSLSIIDVHSTMSTKNFEVTSFLTIVNFLFCSALWILALASPCGSVPRYCEVKRGTEPNPEVYATLWKLLTLDWMYPLLFKGFRQPLTMSDIWDLSEKYRTKLILQNYRVIRRGSLVVKLLKFSKADLLSSSVWTVMQACLAFLPTVLIRAILKYLENPSAEPRHMAWVYVSLLCVTPVINATCSVQSQWGFRGIAIRLRQLVVGELYSKALMRNSASVSFTSGGQNNEDDNEGVSQLSSGSIINLMAVDSYIISDAVMQVQQLIKVFVMLTVSFALLFDTLGWSAVAAIFTMFSIIPGNYVVAVKFGRAMKDMMRFTDQRIHKTNEILQSIKVVKYFAWERRFTEALEEIRENEASKLKERAILWSTAGVFWYGFIPIVTFTTFGSYTLIAKRELTATIAFTSIAIFYLLRSPIEILVDAFSAVVEAKVSLDRIDRFLLEKGTTKYEQMTVPKDSLSPLIGFSSAFFSWGDNSDGNTFYLRNLSIDFQVGKLTVIVGPTGSGKTSLLMALLGEMTLLKGSVFLPSPLNGESLRPDPITGLMNSVAYCAQQPWLLNESIRDNILFGSPYLEGRYKACVYACALMRDLEILEYGDQTSIGEKGIALSGGQKQRISLARALYSSARHVLLDDCLSAVDSHSAQWIYEKCITGALMKNRTCILVSHNVSLTLTKAHHVVVINSGSVKMQGTPREVYMSGALGDDDVIQNSVSVNERNVSLLSSADDLVEQEIAVVNARTRVTSAAAMYESEDCETDVLLKSIEAPDLAEEIEQGSVSWDIYMTYLKAMGSYRFWSVMAFLYLAQQFVQLAQTYWLRQWTNDLAARDGSSDASISESRHSTDYYFWVYGFASLVFVILSVLRPLYMFLGSVRASKRLFKQLLRSVLRSTSRFFDVTPVGRILNRFSKDIETIDLNVSLDVYNLGYTTLVLTFVILTISSIFPLFIVAGILIGSIYIAVTVYYLASARELRRLNSVTRSPIYQHFGETLSGLSTIRAYGCEERFVSHNIERLEANTRPYWAFWALISWLTVRSELIGGTVMAVTSAFLIRTSGSIDAGLAGLCLTYAIQFSFTTMSFVTCYTNTEMDLNSVERVKEYLNLESEAPEVVENNRPSASWPESGAIEVQELSLRYAPTLPKVISKITFTIQPKWKVGIVGRTGAGKSTIASAFFRFLEAETGKILIDGVDISKIGLFDLRSALTIIPQDPTLFTGTIRSNLDPFSLYSDEDIFKALRRVKLIDYVPQRDSDTSNELSNTFHNLSSLVTENGGNFSQGQRQLLCLARSLLKSPRVIILDEATASIDYETDAQLQLTIREEFSESTILTIAHRLRSIIDYDMILVLDSGEVKEYNKPHILLQDPKSMFRSMCESSGELETLKELALAAYEQQKML